MTSKSLPEYSVSMAEHKKQELKGAEELLQNYVKFLNAHLNNSNINF